MISLKQLFALGSMLLLGLFGARGAASLPPARSATVEAAQAVRLAADLEQVIASQNWSGDRWSVMVISLQGGDTLFAHNAGTALAPASNLKLFTTAAALHYLGPDYRYATYLTATGPVRSGVLDGDLLIYGTGDPTFSARFFETRTAIWEALADSLQALGIRRITGDVVGDASYFEGPGYGQGWGQSYITHTYAASASALSFNDNVVTLRVTPGPAVDAPPRVQLVPGGQIQMRNEARTVASGRTRIEVKRETYDAPITLTGQIQRGASDVWRAAPVADPAWFAASMQLQVLRERGIAVEGRIRSIRQSDASPITGQRVFAPAFEEDRPIQALAVHLSPPLLEILKVINQRSHNLYAESVLRTIGRVATGHGSAAGGEAAVLALMEQAGPAAAAIRMDDGSGLSSLNRASAESFVQLLAFMERSPHFEAYRQTLPEAAVSRGLRRMQETGAAGNLRAKTGTIDRVSALSGYVTAENGERLAFSILSNNVPSTWTAKRIEDRIGARLASFSRPTPTPRVAAGPEPSGAEPVAAAAPDTTAPARMADAAVPEAEETTEPASSARYEIRSGDTLDGIAKRHGIPLSDLREANPGLDPRRLIPGRSITIPGDR